MSSSPRHRACAPIMAGSFDRGYFVADADAHRHTRHIAIALWVVVVLAAAGTVAAMLFHNGGGRWFVVETPSMGQTAPVGTIVLTDTAQMRGLAVGDIITFHPPTSPEDIYTHRIVGITADGAISTRGDINGADDPWTLTTADLVGEVSAIVPGAGWLVRAIPILVLGSLLVVTFAQSFSSRSTRSATRVIGFSLIVSLASFLIKPWAGMVVLATDNSGAMVKTTLVSTGLLPIRAGMTGGPHADLVAGQVATLDIPKTTADGYFHLASALHLTPAQWAIVALVCLVPLAWTLIVGIPRDDRMPLA